MTESLHDRLAKHTAEYEALAGIAERLVRAGRELERQSEAQARTIKDQPSGARRCLGTRRR